MTEHPDNVEILKEHLSEDPTDDFLEQIASTVINQIEGANLGLRTPEPTNFDAESLIPLSYKWGQS